MNRILGVMIFLLLGSFVVAQTWVFHQTPLTQNEIVKKRKQLFIQLDSLEGVAERDYFAQTILRDIKKLDEQAMLLQKNP